MAKILKRLSRIGIPDEWLQIFLDIYVSSTQCPDAMELQKALNTGQDPQALRRPCTGVQCFIRSLKCINGYRRKGGYTYHPQSTLLQRARIDLVYQDAPLPGGWLWYLQDVIRHGAKEVKCSEEAFFLQNALNALYETSPSRPRDNRAKLFPPSRRQGASKHLEYNVEDIRNKLKELVTMSGRERNRKEDTSGFPPWLRWNQDGWWANLEKLSCIGIKCSTCRTKKQRPLPMYDEFYATPELKKVWAEAAQALAEPKAAQSLCHVAAGTRKEGKELSRELKNLGYQADKRRPFKFKHQPGLFLCTVKVKNNRRRVRFVFLCHVNDGPVYKAMPLAFEIDGKTSVLKTPLGEWLGNKETESSMRKIKLAYESYDDDRSWLDRSWLDCIKELLDKHLQGTTRFSADIRDDATFSFGGFCLRSMGSVSTTKSV